MSGNVYKSGKPSGQKNQGLYFVLLTLVGRLLMRWMQQGQVNAIYKKGQVNVVYKKRKPTSQGIL